jgi:hypothetical protein
MSTGRGQDEGRVVILYWAASAAFSAAIVAVAATITSTTSTPTTKMLTPATAARRYWQELWIGLRGGGSG